MLNLFVFVICFFVLSHSEINFTSYIMDSQQANESYKKIKYECTECWISCPSKRSLKKHIKKHEADIAPLEKISMHGIYIYIYLNKT